MKFGEIRKPLLIFCLSASVALHCGALWVIYSHPVALKKEDSAILMKSAPSPSMLSKDNAIAFVEKMEKALEDSLNNAIAAAHYSKQAIEETAINEPLETAPAQSPIASTTQINEEAPPAIGTKANDLAISMPPLFDPEQEALLPDIVLDNDLEETIPMASAPKKETSLDFSDFTLPDPAAVAAIVEDDYTMSSEQFSPEAQPANQLEILAPQAALSLKTLKIPRKDLDEALLEQQMFTQLQESSTPQLVLPNSVDYLRSQWMKHTPPEKSLPDLEYYGLDKAAKSPTWEEDLQIEVSLMPSPSNDKYIFSMTIHPEFEMDCKNMRQNFYFVIDRSSSVEKHKLSRYKLAVQRSLAALCEGDTFNIYLFDKHVTKLSEKNLSVTPKTIQMAEEFLEQQSAKTHFAANELYRSLERLLPERFNPNELHSVILITDGMTVLSPQKQKKELGSWAEKFDGNVNFYTAAAGKGNNLVLLDLLSYSTAGRMLYSDTNAGFPRKLVHLIKDLHNPIVKNITIEVTPSASNAHIELFPKASLLPPMFAGQPYVITGTIDELCDLTLFIQGKNHDQSLNVRKRISLKEASTGGRSLEKLWATTQSKMCYEQFLENGKISHLKQAKEIVAPYHGEIASEQ